MESWKKSRLGQDSNPWSCNCIALCSTIELSSHPGAAHFWARVASSRRNMNCHLFDLSYTLCPIYISYGQLKTKSESATLRREGFVAQWQHRVQYNCTVLSSSSVLDCFFFSFLCNCFSCFLDCHDHSNIIFQPFLSGRIFKSYYQKLSLLKGVIHRLSLGIVCIEQLCTHFFL